MFLSGCGWNVKCLECLQESFTTPQPQRMEQKAFEKFCKNKGLDERTMKVLRKKGVTNGESLCVLRDEDFTTEPDLKQLPVVQRRVLQQVLKELREKQYQTQQSDNRHGPPPATSALEREDIDEKEDPDELRIVLIGKTGSGKSSVGNTILNLTKETGGFDPDCGQAAATKICQRKSVKINGKKIRIIDTPGVYDPARDEQEIAQEIGKCLLLCSPGPHVLLFVIKGNDRFTDEEINAYYKLKAMFNSKVQNYIIVVFTGGDILAKRNKAMKDVLKDAEDAIIKVNKRAKGAKPPADIRKVLEEASNRYLLFSNDGDAATKDQQVLALLDMIKKMISKNGEEPFFQNDITRAVLDVKEKEVKRIMVEESVNKEEAEVQLLTSLQKTAAICITAGASVGLASTAVLGAPILSALALAGVAVAGVSVASKATEGHCSVM